MTFTKWQLAAGGPLLALPDLAAEPPLPPLTIANLDGLVWLGLIGATATYGFWLRGIERLWPGMAAALEILGPVTRSVWVGLACRAPDRYPTSWRGNRPCGDLGGQGRLTLGRQ